MLNFLGVLKGIFFGGGGWVARSEVTMDEYNIYANFYVLKERKGEDCMSEENGMSIQWVVKYIVREYSLM